MSQPAPTHAEHLDEILNSMQDAIISFSLPDRQVIFASASVEEVFGYPVETFLRDPQFFRQVVHPDDLAHALDAMQQCLRIGYGELDHRIILPDGEVRWLHRRAWVNYDAAGRPVRVNDSARDITAQKQAEDALRRSEEQFQQFMRNLPGAVFIKDAEGRTRYCNDLYARLSGHTVADIIGKYTADYLPPELAAPFLRENAQVLAENRALGFTHTFPTEAGLTHWFTVKFPIPSHGQAPLLGGVSLDITREKRAEAALQQSAAHLRSLLDSQTTFNVRVDMQGNISFCNDRYVQQFGWMAPSLIGLSSLQMVVPDDHDNVRAAVAQCLEQVGAPVQVELRKLTQDGGQIWTLWEFIAVQEANGEVKEIQCVGFDITRQKHAELSLRQAHDLLEQRVLERTMALEEERKLFRQFVEAAPVATIVTDAAGEIILINQEGEKLFGDTRAALIGQPVERLIPESQRAIHEQHRAHYLVQPARRSVGALELMAQRSDGAVFPVEIQLSVVHGTPTPLVMCQIIDVSARKAAEVTLRQALAQAQELGELKSRFVSMASHEFRTPLAAILASAETLTRYRRRMDDAQIDVSLDRIRRQVKHMQGILEDVMHLVRIQAGRVEFNPTSGDLTALCREIIEEYESIAAHRERIIFDSTDGLPPLIFDARLMRHILSNLLSNALKYSAAGQSVQVQLARTHAQVTLQVRDAGIGIPADDIRHLFEPFHRAANVGAISGTGLGLCVVKQAVDLHGGAITIDSQVGEGATFTVTLPLAGIEE